MTITMDRPQTSGNDRIRNADYLLGLPASSEDAEAIERDRARRAVERVAGQDAAELLDMLGLVPEPNPEPTIRPTGKRCSTCGETKPRTEYYKRASASDGLYSQCKTCHNASRARSARKHPRDQRAAGGSDRNITWKISAPGGRGVDCTRKGVNERRDTYGALIRKGLTPREAAEEMRIGMRTARRYHAELRDRGQL
jgi:hypothetical protein